MDDGIRTPMIVPIYWTGTPPIESEKYEIDCSNYNMEAAELPADLIKEMHDKFNQVGLVVLKNTGLTKLKDMERATTILVPNKMSYTGGANSRGAIEENVYDTGAPRVAHLHYHHEMAYVGRSVTKLAFCAGAATIGKGPMFVSDNIKATEAILATELGQNLKEKGICYIRNLTDREAYKSMPAGWNGYDAFGVYNHWQRSFGVETKEEVEPLAKARGLQVEWGPNNFLKTKYYISAYEYYPPMDKNLLYSSVADDSMWFDTWPGISEMPTFPDYGDATMAERPLKLTYGDDTEFTREELQTYVDVYDRFGLPINWRLGDVAIVCNWRWAHGRPSYDLEPGERRELGVVLGETFGRLGDFPGKW